MPKIVPVGPLGKYAGKTLWEILGNLKNFGIGRYVQCVYYERYPEPSYYRILKIETLPAPMESETRRKVRAYAERCFRGVKFEKIYEMEDDSSNTIFRLVPKAEEESLLKKVESAAAEVEKRRKILPRTVGFPPLLKEFIIQDRIAKGLPVDEEPRMKRVICDFEDLLYRVAEPGEKPTVDIPDGKGTPISPQLYEIPQLFKEKYKL